MTGCGGKPDTEQAVLLIDGENVPGKFGGPCGVCWRPGRRESRKRKAVTDKVSPSCYRFLNGEPGAPPLLFIYLLYRQTFNLGG